MLATGSADAAPGIGEGCLTGRAAVVVGTLDMADIPLNERLAACQA